MADQQQTSGTAQAAKRKLLEAAGPRTFGGFDAESAIVRTSFSLLVSSWSELSKSCSKKPSLKVMGT